MQDYFFVRSDNRFVRLNFRDIVYVEAVKNYLKIHVRSSGKPFFVLLSMKQMEQSLPQCGFCRVHRSYLINLDCVTSFDQAQVMLGNMSLPMSEQYKNQLLARVNLLISDVRNKGKFRTFSLEVMEHTN